MNVAYHLHRLGRTVLPVTAVGDDEMGHRLLNRFHRLGLDTTFVSVSRTKPTGTVNVSFDEQGNPRYDIVENVAWDEILVTDELVDRAGKAAAVIYGTLAQRSGDNRRGLLRLLDAARAGIRVFDVNFRPPYYTHDLVRELAGHSSLIKVNDEELHELTESDHPEEGVRILAERFGCRNICVTAGSKGAGVLLDGRWQWVDGSIVTVEVVDTVGAGDAFLAGLVHGLLRGDMDPAEIVGGAYRLGAFVASSEGATPDYSTTDAQRIVEGKRS